MSVRQLDLNTRSTLKHWSVSKALIELVANALDEATETKTKLPTLQWDNDVVTIQDSGRGLKTEHFQQDINPFKQNNHAFIGKFGVGLKDALAVLYNNEQDITLESKYLYADKLELTTKQNFEEKSIHVAIQAPRNKKLVGTLIKVSPITQGQYREVRSYFHVYADLGPVIADTRAGKLYARKKGKKSAIYLNGIKVSEEANFMYQYAIVANTKNIMTVMCSDRDRNAITRSTYADKVQQILEFACDHVQKVRDAMGEVFESEDAPPYDEFRYKKIKALQSEIAKHPAASPVAGEIKILLAKKERTENPSEEDEEEEEEEEKAVPPVPRARVKVRYTLEDEEYREALFVKGRAMLAKIFSADIPTFRFEDDSVEEDALSFTRKDIKNEKIFFRCLMRKYIRYCLNDPDEESLFVNALIRVATKDK